MRELLDWEENELIGEEAREDDAGTDEELDARAAKRDRLRGLLKRELRWFYGTLGGRVPEEGAIDVEARARALVIDGHLKAIPAFHRGALALCYTPPRWSRAPGSLASNRSLTGLVVRLECVSHPSEGGKTIEQLEAEAIERLTTGNACSDVFERADAHERLALAAYLKVRGDGPCLGPRGRPCGRQS
jgi:hypothetical protein